VAAEMPFPVQRVQTDRGREFFAYEVQDRLRDRRIKFRPNRPRAPHLNGKVERVQRTALEEFWPTVDPKGGPDLAARLEAWRSFYNHHRSHSALGGGTPAERIAELAAKIPSLEAVHAAYDPSREFIRSQNTRYRWLPTRTRVT
jgi:transposase InsO family protein